MGFWSVLGIIGLVLFFTFYGDIVEVIEHQLEKWKHN